MRWASGLVLALTIALLGVLCPRRDAAWAQGTTSEAAVEIQGLLSRIRAIADEKDSLAALAEAATGEERTVLKEQIWDRQEEMEAALLATADNLRRQEAQGADISEPRRVLGEMIRRGWARYQRLLRGAQDDLETLRRERDTATGPQRMAIESRMSEHAERQAARYRSLVDAILALERAGVDFAEQRRFTSGQLARLADELVARLRVAERERSMTAAQVARTPSEQALRHELFAIEESRKRVGENLAIAIELLDRLGVETSGLKVSLITETGRISADAFDTKVIRGLLQYARKETLNFLATRAPRWLFHGLVLILVLAGFRLLALLVRSIVRRAVARTQFSHLLREALIAGSKHVVMGIGLIVVLAQLGVQVGALLAGLGIAGFVLGFAMQSTLANFVAGGMILAYRPYDLGDVIEAGSAAGTVRAMSLVATTIVTVDNQTLIVPNSKIWGDVIRNITAQTTRRVDLTFGVGYVDDIEKAERVLKEILAANDKVLKDPAPVVKLHQLADGALHFVVRPWTLTENYWDVHWEVTRAVKVRFDQEKISIPGSRRDLYLHNVSEQR
jgi:small conductance mechanosensitive channel